MVDLFDRRERFGHGVQVQLHVGRHQRLPSLPLLEEPVAQNRKQPAACRGRIAQLMQRLLSSQKSLLRQIFRIGRTPGQPEGKPIYRQMELLNKLLDRDGRTSVSHLSLCKGRV